MMKDLGYGKGYRYDHDTEEGFSGQDYFPDAMSRESYYKPVERGFERELAKRLAYWAKTAGACRIGKALMVEHCSSDESAIPHCALIPGAMLLSSSHSKASDRIQKNQEQ